MAGGLSARVDTGEAGRGVGASYSNLSLLHLAAERAVVLRSHVGAESARR